ncbi:MAG: D-Ala-D-Ala carboxypeptidase family metallohydrolase [Elainellaceae cyanobacterium]
MTRLVLVVKNDTYFKLRTQLSSELDDNEKVFIEAGKSFELHSYAYADPVEGSFNGHIKVALKGSTLQGFNTWFVYSLHSQVELDGAVVYPYEDQEAIPVLWTTQDTIFKRRPVQSSLLSSSEVYAVSRGQQLFLHSYAYSDNQGGFDSHIKVAIRYEQDYLNDLSSWFVYDRHGYVEYDDQVVYPSEDPNIPVLRVKQDTVFKRRPLQSSLLPADELYRVPQGTTWKLNSYAYQDSSGNDFFNHVKFALKYPKDEINGFNTWYVYSPHMQVEVAGKVVYPVPKPPPLPPTPTYSGIPFKLPGNVSTFYTDQPIIANGSFTWGEATKNATRIPNTVAIVESIVALARELQKARNQLNRSFQVNSWYRPPAVNAAVGGASRSYHLTGKATDLEVSGYNGRQVANAVFGWWPGGIGIYSNLPNVVHLDIGPRRTWGI